jgi:hypothetical protein
VRRSGNPAGAPALGPIVGRVFGSRVAWLPDHRSGSVPSTDSMGAVCLSPGGVLIRLVLMSPSTCLLLRQSRPPTFPAPPRPTQGAGGSCRDAEI